MYPFMKTGGREVEWKQCSSNSLMEYQQEHYCDEFDNHIYEANMVPHQCLSTSSQFFKPLPAMFADVAYGIV